MILPANRTQTMKYAIRDVVVEAQRLAKQGKKILYLNIGDPIKFDYETPKHLIKAIEDNWKESAGYSHSSGIPEAREAIAKEAKRNGYEVDPEDVLVTNGGSEAITIAMGALANRGDNILTPSPGYPLYTSLVSYFECGFNEYYLNEEDEWQPDIDDMRKKINDKTKALLLINPNNPTGSICSKNTVKEVLDLAGEHNIPVLSDETYDKLIIEGEHYPAAAVSNDVPVITFNSLSKSYLAPGWRTGWAVPYDPSGTLAEVTEAMKKLSRSRLCSNHPTQYAIKPALEGDQSHIEKLKKKLKERRDISYRRMNEISGLTCVKPKAAFYAFPRLEFEVESDEEFVMGLLKQTGVLTVFGSGFGEKPGTHHFRTVFLPPPKILEEAFDRIEEYIERHY